MNTLFYIAVTIFVIYGLILIFTTILSKKQDENSVTIDKGFAINSVDSLNELIIEAIRLKTAIQETKILIDKCAEVRPTILNEKDDNYVSFDVLVYWKNSYISQLGLKMVVIKNSYNILSQYNIMTENDKTIIYKEIRDLIEFLVDNDS